MIKVLSLDGGGAKGVYSLGVLREVEAALGKPLSYVFGLIYGTSTGAIIASLLGIGKGVDEIRDLYLKHVPTIMRRRTKSGRSMALRSLASNVFGDLRFDAFKTRIGIVATSWDFEKPMIFKTSFDLAHGRKATFQPGFGCTIAQAVEASCSAYPFFERPRIPTSNQGIVELADGGYCANNPTLYAIADCLSALGEVRANVRVLNVGVGAYPEPKHGTIYRAICNLNTVRLLQKTLNVNAASMEQLRKVLFPDVPVLRVSETFERPELAADLFEHDLKKLNLLYMQGRESFGKYEKEIKELINHG